VSENDKLIERKPTELIKEKSQYAIAFGVIAMMLYITGFPLFVIFFLRYSRVFHLENPVRAVTERNARDF